MSMHATSAYFEIFMLQRIYIHFTKHCKIYNTLYKLYKWTHGNGEKKTLHNSEAVFIVGLFV